MRHGAWQSLDPGRYRATARTGNSSSPPEGSRYRGWGGTRVETDAHAMKATRIEKVYRIRAAHYPIWFMTVILLTVCGAIYTVTAWATSVALR